MAKIKLGSISETQERGSDIFQKGTQLLKKKNKTETERRAAVSFVLTMTGVAIVVLLLIIVMLGFISEMTSNSLRMIFEMEQTAQSVGDAAGSAEAAQSASNGNNLFIKLFVWSVPGFTVIALIYSAIARNTFAKPWGEYYKSLNSGRDTECETEHSADQD